MVPGSVTMTRPWHPHPHEHNLTLGDDDTIKRWHILEWSFWDQSESIQKENAAKKFLTLSLKEGEQKWTLLPIYIFLHILYLGDNDDRSGWWLGSHICSRFPFCVIIFVLKPNFQIQNKCQFSILDSWDDTYWSRIMQLVCVCMKAKL